MALLPSRIYFSLLEQGKKLLILRGRDVEMSIITHERAAFMGYGNSTEGQIFGERQLLRALVLKGTHLQGSP